MADDFRGWNILIDDAESKVARAIRKCVGRDLRAIYGHVLNEPMPPNIAGLLRRLDDA